MRSVPTFIIGTTESSLNHRKIKKGTEESFACVLGILDDEPQSW